jgi:hypothetical protein
MALSPSSVYNFGERHWQMLRAARAAVRKPATNLSGTCAVVGSSAALFDAKHGSEIDAARHVLRLNNAPVPARWREHIGQRTTLRVNTHQTFREREDDEYGLRDIPQVVYCHHEGSGCWNGVQKDGLDRIAPGFVQATIDELGLQSGWPTSGLIAVALARSMCAEVHVYGFGLSKTQPCAKYYGRHCEPPAQYQKTEWHDFALEKDYLDRESVPVLKGFGVTKCSDPPRARDLSNRTPKKKRLPGGDYSPPSPRRAAFARLQKNKNARDAGPAVSRCVCGLQIASVREPPRGRLACFRMRLYGVRHPGPRACKTNPVQEAASLFNTYFPWLRCRPQTGPGLTTTRP